MKNDRIFSPIQSKNENAFEKKKKKKTKRKLISIFMCMVYLKLKSRLSLMKAQSFSFYMFHKFTTRLICIPYREVDRKENCVAICLEQKKNFGSKQRQKIAIICQEVQYITQYMLWHKSSTLHVKSKTFYRKLYGLKWI